MIHHRGTDTCVDRNLTNCQKGVKKAKVFIFVGYVEVLGEDKEKMDVVDRKLDYLRLGWER